MKTQPKSKKLVIGIIVVILVVLLGYFYFSGGSTPAQSNLLQQQNTPEAEIIGMRILNLLNQIRSLKIDKTIFQDPSYQTLVDYSVPIPAVGVGRPNPFAPLPGSVVVPAR